MSVRRHPSSSSRQVPGRVLAAGLAMVVVLAAVLGGTIRRDRAALPAAAAELRLALNHTAAVLSCFEGVQDDLTSGPGGAPVATGVGPPSRLESCDVDALAARTARITLPPAPPLSSGRDRAARQAIEQGAATLRRVVLDSAAAKAAMEAGSANALKSEKVVLAYRSAYSGFASASADLVVAEHALSIGPGFRSG